jgi:hypothetical protein
MLLRVGDPGYLSELGILAGDGYLDVTARAAADISTSSLSGSCSGGSRSQRRLDRVYNKVNLRG